jgi:hypothetical protein
VSTISTSIAVLFASVGLNAAKDVAHDRVDLIEVNHFFDEQGQPVFDQIIFYDWSPQMGRYLVRAWRPLRTSAQIPQRDWEQRDYVAVWHDGTTFRKVRAATMRETWTQYDPELVGRAYLPREQRGELARSRAVSVAAK